MYNPKHFVEPDVQALHALMREYPFATLVTRSAGGLDANHVPFVVDPEPAPFGTLRAHVARANPVWREVGEEPSALVIFQGPYGYVSPSFYPSKREDPRVVPTWNYFVAHAHGRVKVIEDVQWLHWFVSELTATHEAGRETPWKVTDAPADFVDKMLTAIVGLEMPIERLVGKRKMSQNRTERDRQEALEGLARDAARKRA